MCQQYFTDPLLRLLQLSPGRAEKILGKNDCHTSEKLAAWSGTSGTSKNTLHFRIHWWAKQETLLYIVVKRRHSSRHLPLPGQHYFPSASVQSLCKAREIFHNSSTRADSSSSRTFKLIITISTCIIYHLCKSWSVRKLFPQCNDC